MNRIIWKIRKYTLNYQKENPQNSLSLSLFFSPPRYVPQMWNVMDELKKYCAKVTSCMALSICNKG